MIITNENIFLIVFGLIWIIGAVLQDLHRREVDNLWNFSLIGIALAYRAAVSVFGWNYWFLLNGFIGLGVFLLLGNLFYYSRLFAGGDAKLLIALGPILPLSYNWLVNLKIFGIFILLFLIGGSVYALFYSFVLMANNFNTFKKEFSKQFISKSNLILIFLVFAIAWTIFMFFIGEKSLILIGFIILLFPILLVFSKSIEEVCLVKEIYSNKLTVGDWLYEDIIVGGRRIKSNWEGVSKNELRLIKTEYRRKILIKQGIPFTPGFLIGYVGLIIVSWYWIWL